MAVKLLLPEATEDARLRFALEGRLLRRLGGRHHLVRCDQVLDHPPALVLELVGQETLAERLATGPLPLRLALACVRQAASAVEWLHANGVLHRDVKASNLILADDGTWRLVDLGVAALGDPPRGLPEGWIEEEIGTLGYAAPELLRDPASAGPTADVYGLGVVCYEAVSGRRPVEPEPGETDPVFRARAAAGPVPVSLADRGDYPAALVRLVDRAVAPDPAARFPSAAALSRAFGGLG